MRLGWAGCRRMRMCRASCFPGQCSRPAGELPKWQHPPWSPNFPLAAHRPWLARADDFRPGNLSAVLPGVKVHRGFLNQFASLTTSPDSGLLHAVCTAGSMLVCCLHWPAPPNLALVSWYWRGSRRLPGMSGRTTDPRRGRAKMLAN